MYPTLTSDENSVLARWSMWGATGYPVVKRGRYWWVDGDNGCGRCPKGFPTKREAVAQWEAYIGTLRNRAAEGDRTKELAKASKERYERELSANNQRVKEWVVISSPVP